ncbi:MULTISPECIES: hypothetical protein [Methylobacterium]|uniref:Uncharacterized protein n=1 Tax=Methylobacterium jeotgali TaxID=381630 RepID=A0ABQ4SXN1_9HYPH|nr:MULTISPECIES: hypothetical protein [Methylobacterium]PIU08751.1 MAG: hypothetical protein COT56_00030 [Methylobacterium sp. CG09_land_8_20_14_0_10_71_15]PIU16363.1 MAG: hypothetical protein COT28_00755 [Methylobacterium sp. CG08_land_8_20_14_0_20_71_15]GBU16050.1 hypothetical protein AwMethylo_02650 [Methylobacterium sp.]GJE07228.1 hypothetical protein AOPFMNJM_2554 [Methylobacterium jeotgali]
MPLALSSPIPAALSPARLAVVLTLALSGTTLAQEPARPVDTTGTGGGPLSTITAPNTVSTGVTKPPAGAGAPTTGAEGPTVAAQREREAREKADNARITRITRSICRGC